MKNEEIIKKIKESNDTPALIITKKGECILAFPEGFNEELNEVEFVRLDKYALALQEDNFGVELLKETIKINYIVSVFSSAELFSSIEKIYKIQQCNKKSDLFRIAFDNTKSIELFLLK